MTLAEIKARQSEWDANSAPVSVVQLAADRAQLIDWLERAMSVLRQMEKDPLKMAPQVYIASFINEITGETK